MSRLFLARGGVTFAYYVIPLLPLLALNLALLVHSVIALAALTVRVSTWLNTSQTRA
jgi:hypothetical protein